METSELIELLEELAISDLSDGSELHEHPCSLVVEELKQNADDIDHLRKIIKGETNPRSKRSMVLITGKQTIGTAMLVDVPLARDAGN